MGAAGREFAIPDIRGADIAGANTVITDIVAISAPATIDLVVIVGLLPVGNSNQAGEI